MLSMFFGMHFSVKSNAVRYSTREASDFVRVLRQALIRGLAPPIAFTV
jgi:hypothetical protein